MLAISPVLQPEGCRLTLTMSGLRRVSPSARDEAAVFFILCNLRVKYFALANIAIILKSVCPFTDSVHARRT